MSVRKNETTVISESDPDVIRIRIINKLKRDIEIKEQELESLKKALSRFTENDALPKIHIGKDYRYGWECRICGKIAGWSIFLHHIPFYPESVCKDCESQSGINLNEIGESL